MAEFARVRLVNDAEGGDNTARKHNDEEKTQTTGLQP
jgi:hypothetical protein